MTELSIILPAWNEQGKIAADMAAADAFLRAEAMTGEIIVVDDGSTDDTAGQARRTAGVLETPCRVERLDVNRGKGCAVRTGVLLSRGDYVLFTDSGNCVPLADVKVGLAMIRDGQAAIANGSRKLTDSRIDRDQSLYRKLCSRLFHWFLIHDIKRLGNLTDTQCGFKLYRGDVARRLYAESRVDGFVFDIEVILLALAGGVRIVEFPVDWTCDPDSRLKPVHQAYAVFRDLVRLKRRFRDVLNGPDAPSTGRPVSKGD